jgi:hypothetical protein
MTNREAGINDAHLIFDSAGNLYGTTTAIFGSSRTKSLRCNDLGRYQPARPATS